MEWVPLALLTAFPTKQGYVTNMDIEVIWTHIKQKFNVIVQDALSFDLLKL